MSDRYFVETPIAAEQVELSGTEAHHLTHVMRADVGDGMVLFDGRGAEFVGEIARLSKRGVTITIRQKLVIDREVTRPIILAVAMPKGDRQKWLVEKATEMGVTTLVPLLTQRAVAQPVENALARLRRSVVEASKQCGRNRLMEIAEPEKWQDFVKAVPCDARRWVAHPGGANVDRHSPVQTATYIAIGPEGGFTDDEVAAAVAAGWTCVDLGPRILRVETAALLLSAWAL